MFAYLGRLVSRFRQENFPQLAGSLAFTTLFALVGRSTLTPAEQQIAYLAVSVLHGCEYCVAGHTYLGRSAAVAESTLQALRQRGRFYPTALRPPS